MHRIERHSHLEWDWTSLQQLDVLKRLDLIEVKIGDLYNFYR